MRALLLILGCTLLFGRAPAVAAPDTDVASIAAVLPTTGLRIVTELHTLSDVPGSSLCRTHGATNSNGTLSVLDGRPDCQRRARRANARRLELNPLGALGPRDPFGAPALGGLPGLPGLPTAATDPQGEGAGEETQGGADVVTANIALPVGSLVTRAIPSLRPAPTELAEAAPSPTPAPPAVWLFAGGMSVLLLRRRAR